MNKEKLVLSLTFVVRPCCNQRGKEFVDSAIEEVDKLSQIERIVDEFYRNSIEKSNARDYMFKIKEIIKK